MRSLTLSLVADCEGCFAPLEKACFQHLTAIRVARTWPFLKLLFNMTYLWAILYIRKRPTLLQPRTQLSMLLLLAFEMH